MLHDPNIIGIYALPAPLLLSEECLGQRVPLKIGNLDGDLILPSAHRSPPRDEMVKFARLAPPEMFGDARDRIEAEQYERGLYGPPYAWSQSERWGADRSYDESGSSIRVCMAVVEVSVPGERIFYRSRIDGRPGEPAGKPLYELFTGIDPWFDRVRTWIETLTDQDADPYQPLQAGGRIGNGLTLVTREMQALSLPRASWLVGSARANHRQEAISFPLLQCAIEQANRRASPSDAHLLLRDGRAAFRRGYRRRAVIEAGSAVEIVLANLNRQVTQVDPDGRSPTLGWYVRQRSIATAASLPANTLMDLVNVRNRAIHENLVPTVEAAISALRLAQQIVCHLEPLPTGDDRRAPRSA
jgi:hypothetical protein